MTKVKCVVVGDARVGKTSLIVGYLKGDFSETVDHTSECVTYSESIKVEDQEIALQLWDTPGSEAYVKIRWPSYPQTDVFLLCFSLVYPWTLRNLQNMWVHDVKQRCPTGLIVLVGMQSDLRDQFEQHAEEYRNRGREPVSASEVEEVKNAINASAYVECSAKTRSSLISVFDAAIKALMHQPSD
jgi:small GTP-binding protein